MPMDGAMDGDGRTVARVFRAEASKSILLAMAGSAATSRFVGRGAELGRLEAAFEYVGGGEPVTMCVGGEAGVGKTRLVTEFGGRVRAGDGDTWSRT